MGTSLFKSAALLGAVLLAASPAHSAGAGGTATGGMGTSAGMAGAVGSTSQGTSAAPGAAGVGTPLGTSSTNALSRPSTSMGITAADQGLTNNPNLATNQNLSSNPATNPNGVGGLTASEQSLLANFGTGSAAGNSGPTPAEQMQSNAQANADSALRNGAPSTLAPPGLSATGSATGSTTGGATASTAGPGASIATTTGIAAPSVSAPVANNPGTSAETVQPGLF